MAAAAASIMLTGTSKSVNPRRIARRSIARRFLRRAGQKPASRALAGATRRRQARHDRDMFRRPDKPDVRDAGYDTGDRRRAQARTRSGVTCGAAFGRWRSSFSVVVAQLKFLSMRSSQSLPEHPSVHRRRAHSCKLVRSNLRRTWGKDLRSPVCTRASAARQSAGILSTRL